MVRGKSISSQFNDIFHCRAAEYSQTDWGIARVKEWGDKSGHLEDEDILISASVDEVMSRSALQQLKWCRISEDVISGALWVPMGNLNKAMRQEFAAEGRPHSFAMPTIYKWKGIRTGEQSGRRLIKPDLRGKYVGGGVHMTSTAFIPTSLLKELTATEDDFFNRSINIPYLLIMNITDLLVEQQRMYTLAYKHMWKDSLGENSDI